MAKAEKGGGNNLTRQHYQIATGNKVVAGKPSQAKAQQPSFSRGARVTRSRG